MLFVLPAVFYAAVAVPHGSVQGLMTTTVALAGSTGSIGTQTLDVVRAEPDRYEVVALGASGRNVKMPAGRPGQRRRCSGGGGRLADDAHASTS